MKDVKPATIADTKFYREEARSRVDSCPRKRRKTADLSPIDDEMAQQFLQVMCTITDTLPIMLHMFDETCMNFVTPAGPPPVSMPTHLRKMYDEANASLSLAELLLMAEQAQQEMAVTSEQVLKLQEATLQQSKCIEWYRQRAGRITASTAHDVLHTNQHEPSQSLITRITSDSDVQLHAPAIVHGRRFEAVTFGELQEVLPHCHKGATLSHVGMRLSEQKPWLAASADGIICCECHGTGVLEIKCPYTFRDSSYEDMLAEQSRSCLDPAGELKPNHRYFTQVQLQMYVYDVDFCIFVVRSGSGLAIQTIFCDKEYLTSTLPKLDKFWGDHIGPELLTRRLEHEKQRVAAAVPVDQPVVCYCQKPEDPDNEDPAMQLVGCDGAQCPYQWVHLGCIRPKRKTVPKGTWYCKSCKKAKKTVKS